jgi:hypothetical protein
LTRRYLFSDESGDLQFKRKNSTRYFAVGTLFIEQDELVKLRSTLSWVRDELAWLNHGLDSFFHATTDTHTVRQLVFAALSQVNFRIDVTLMDKAKAQPQTRVTEPKFFQYSWFFHLRQIAPTMLQEGDELLVVAASIGTKKGRAAFRSAIEDVLTQCVDFRVKRTLAFWRDESDFALQAVDYCTWAVTRKWEKGDATYYDLIRDKIVREYDLFQKGQMLYY